MDTIKIKPEELEDSSNKIKNYAEQFDNILSDISKTLLGLECFWMGQGFFEFQGEFNLLSGKMKEVTGYIEGISQDLNTVATQMKQADLRASGFPTNSFVSNQGATGGDKESLWDKLSDEYDYTRGKISRLDWGHVGTAIKTVGIDWIGGSVTAIGGVVALSTGNVYLGAPMITYGANSMGNAWIDHNHELNSEWDKVGKTNLLQDSMKSFAENYFPKDIADPIAETFYLGGAYFSLGGYKGILKSVTDLRSLGTSNVYQATKKGWKLVSSTAPTIAGGLNTAFAPLSNGFSVKDIVTGANNVKSEVVSLVKDHLLKPLGVCKNESSKSVLATN